LEALNLDPCAEAQAWINGLPASTTPEAAWLACERADWLRWLAEELRIDRALVVAARCECLRVVLPLWEEVFPDDDAPRRAVEALEGWLRGEVPLRHVVKATLEARDVALEAMVEADKDDRGRLGNAKDAAVEVAFAAAELYTYRGGSGGVLTHDEEAVAVAICAAIGAENEAAAYEKAYYESLRASAEIVRKHIPWSVIHEYAVSASTS
jgi:hypothetical protein